MCKRWRFAGKWHQDTVLNSPCLLVPDYHHTQKGLAVGVALGSDVSSNPCLLL